MTTSCFFCQNLLSDFIEGILPSSRHEELKKHLDGCDNCREVHQDLSTTLKTLKKLGSIPITNDLSIRAVEAAHAGERSWLSRAKIVRFATYGTIPVVLLLLLSFVFPNSFPLTKILTGNEDSGNFVRYFPLLQGAVEIIEEQSSMLHMREPSAGSLWEEGGMTPEEFEKSFQRKGPSGSGP
jgi:hypothetical protein